MQNCYICLHCFSLLNHTNIPGQGINCNASANTAAANDDDVKFLGLSSRDGGGTGGRTPWSGLGVEWKSRPLLVGGGQEVEAEGWLF